MSIFLLKSITSQAQDLHLTPTRTFTPKFQTYGLRNIELVLAKVGSNLARQDILKVLAPRRDGQTAVVTAPVEFRTDGVRLAISYFLPKKEGLGKMSKSRGGWRKVCVSFS